MPNVTANSPNNCPRLPKSTRWRRQEWSDPELLEICAAHRAPRAPGLVLLFLNEPSDAPVFWAGVTPNIQDRLDEMLRCPQEDPVLESLLAPYPRDVSFRYLVVPSARRRARLLDAISAAPKPAPAAAQSAGVTS